MNDANKQYDYDCIIVVDERGDAMLLKSKPSLYDNDTFDGNYLQDNINKDNKLIPTEFGIYRCKIHSKWHESYTDFGTEYDCDIWISDVVKLNLDLIK